MNQPNDNNTNIEPTANIPDEQAPPKKPYGLIIFVLVIVFGIGGGAWMWYRNTHGIISTDDAYIDANRLTVSAKILGRVVELSAIEGQSIEKGQILVRIDDSDLQAQCEQAKTSITLASENIKMAVVSEQRAQEDFDRGQKQIKDKVITTEQFDHIQKELELAHSRVSIAKATEASSTAQLNVIETQLKNTVIEAPMSGVVAKKWVLPGDIVQPGQAIYSIYDLSDVWVVANFEETKLSALHMDSRAELTVDAYPQHLWSGKVYQIGTNTAAQFTLIPPSNASGNFTKVTQRVPIKITIENSGAGVDKDVRLLPGMSIEVKIRVG